MSGLHPPKGTLISAPSLAPEPPRFLPPAQPPLTPRTTQNHPYFPITLPMDASSLPIPSAASPEADLLSQVSVTTEHLDGRRRRLQAQIWIPAGIDRVWAVLTDYEALANFIPNLAKSQVLEQESDRVRLEQVGTEKLWKVSFSAKVVLDMVLEAPHAIRFSQFQGDFNEFQGAWLLAPQAQDNQAGTQLTYELTVHPKRTMPVKLVECNLNVGLPRNLAAIYQETLRRLGQ